jgi:hypothetical protein
VYGFETWAVAEIVVKRLGTGERIILRRIHRPVVDRGIWRVRTDGSMSRHSSRYGMYWTCRKMDQGRTVRGIYMSKLEGSRIRGRPRLRWLEYIEKDLREMKVK